METIFIAGVYGVGKSTLCRSLGNSLNIPSFSAGDLISKINGEDYKQSKAVKDAVYNQEVLVAEVELKLKKHPIILLAGHFCIFNEQNHVEVLPYGVFEKLHIKQILLLDADTNQIISNLLSRDKKFYDYEQVVCLQKEEQTVARHIANLIECPLDVHYMSYDANDSAHCVSILTKNGIIFD